MASRKSRKEKQNRPVIPADKPEVAETTPQQTNTALSVYQRSLEFSGPIPPPEILKAYGEIIPDAPERILARLEKQSDHRQELERKVIESDISLAFCGLWIGAGLAFVMITGGLAAIFFGHGAYGLASVGAAAATLATAFIARVYSKKKSIEDKPHPKKPSEN